MQVVMMFGTSLLFFVAIGVVYLVTVAYSFLENVWFEKYVHSEIMFIIWLVGLAATFALFLFLYRFSPAETLSRSGLLLASGTATVLFQVSKWAFGIYLQYAKTTSAIYGALSALVFFFLWLHYVCAILFSPLRSDVSLIDRKTNDVKWGEVCVKRSNRKSASWLRPRRFTTSHESAAVTLSCCTLSNHASTGRQSRAIRNL